MRTLCYTPQLCQLHSGICQASADDTLSSAMNSFDYNQQALHIRHTSWKASSWSAKALPLQVAVPYLVTCSKQHVIWSHESGKLVSVDWLQVAVVREDILLQLGKLRKKACQYLLAQLELRVGYVNLIF